MSALSPSRHRELVQGGPTFQSSSCSPQGVPVSPAHSKLGQAEGISGSLWVHSLSCSMGAEGQQELREVSAVPGACSTSSSGTLYHFCASSGGSVRLPLHKSSGPVLCVLLPPQWVAVTPMGDALGQKHCLLSLLNPAFSIHAFHTERRSRTHQTFSGPNLPHKLYSWLPPTQTLHQAPLKS